MQLLNTSCGVRSTACTVLDGLFSRLAQLITNKRGRMWRVQWHSIMTCIFKVIQLCLCNETAILCYILSCPLYSTCSCRWILSIFGTLVWEDLSHNDLWPIYCKIVWLWRCLYTGLYSYVATIQPVRGRCVTYHFHVSRSRSHRPFEFLREGGWGVGWCIPVDHWTTIYSYHLQSTCHPSCWHIHLDSL